MSRGGRIVLQAVSFRVDPGQALQVTGRNGVGKSTLLRALAGFLPLAGGRVSWGAASDAEPTEVPLAERLHYVGHADALKSALTARENLVATTALAGAPLAPIEAALERLNMLHAVDLPVAYLSAGQRRRVALARLMAAYRPLWLLDEPTTALDAGSQQILADVMSEHLAAGGLIVAATHAELRLDVVRDLRLDP